MRRKQSRMERLARNFKNAGATKKEFIDVTSDTVNRMAKEENWRPAERALALAEYQQIAERVWG